MAAQRGALKTFFSGIDFDSDGPHRLDDDGLPALARFIQSAPALAALTGVPSARGGRFQHAGLP